MNKNSLLIIVLAILGLLFVAWYITRPATWEAWPTGIIVDTPEEFQRKNTP